MYRKLHLFPRKLPIMLRKLKKQLKHQVVHIETTSKRGRNYLITQVKIRAIIWHGLKHAAKYENKHVNQIIIEAIKLGFEKSKAEEGKINE